MNYLFFTTLRVNNTVIGIFAIEMKTHPVARLFLVLVSTMSYGQDIRVPHDFIYQILDDSGLISDVVFSSTRTHTLEITDIPFAKEKFGPTQKIVRTSHGLFILVEGTGRIYEVFKNEYNFQAKRIDSTIFFGNNFGAIHFAFHDTIYSFGGYGFWRYNGQLRAYLPDKHEWELVELDREVPIQIVNPMAVRSWFDHQQGRLFVVRMPGKTLGTDSVCALSMASKKWTTLGISSLSSDLSEFVQTPFGLLARAADSQRDLFYLLDFRTNRILEMNLSKAQEIRSYENSGSLMYCSDSTIVIYGNGVDKVKIGMGDFRETPKTIYEGNSETGSKSLNFKSDSLKLYFLTFALTLILGFGVGRWWTKSTKRPMDEMQLSVPTLFAKKEKDLIRLTFENSSNSLSTSIDDINRVLGLSEKGVDVQKKHRSDIIISINKKFNYITNENRPLFKKSRSQEDKRTFEFCIDFEDYARLNGLL